MFARLGVLFWAASMAAQDDGVAIGRHLSLNGEFRFWPEARTGIALGRDPEVTTPLIRTRIGAVYTPSDWFRAGVLLQDARAPYYGRPAPGSARDELDVHEAYIDLLGRDDKGFGARIGRTRVSLGSTNFIGSPEWSNTGRTYDAARVFYLLPGVRLEALLVSTVKVRPDEFNRPVLGDRIWGTYSTFARLVKSSSLDVFVLRHHQNVPGGFSGPGRLLTTTSGFRLASRLRGGFTSEAEIAGQWGHAGEGSAGGSAIIGMLRKQISLGRAVDLSIEYRQASPDFDQLYPANHNRFGHADILGFRNIRSTRGIGRLELWKGSTLTLAHTSNWAFDASRPIYSPGARVLALPSGRSNHIGQELAVYTNHEAGHFEFGVGFAHWFLGGYTSGVNPRYLYFHQGVRF